MRSRSLAEQGGAGQNVRRNSGPKLTLGRFCQAPRCMCPQSSFVSEGLAASGADESWAAPAATCNFRFTLEPDPDPLPP